MVVFSGGEETCNLSLSHTDINTHTGRPQVSSSRESAWTPSYRTCCRVQSLSCSGFRGAEDHVKPIEATRSRRLVLTPGKRSGVFTNGRTLTCSFLLRFGRFPKTSFHYLPVSHRCSGGFRAVTPEGAGSVSLLCCRGCLAGLRMDSRRCLFEIRLQSVWGQWSLWKSDHKMQTVGIFMQVLRQHGDIWSAHFAKFLSWNRIPQEN